VGSKEKGQRRGGASNVEREDRKGRVRGGGGRTRASLHACMLVREKEMEGMLVWATRKFP